MVVEFEVVFEGYFRVRGVRECRECRGFNCRGEKFMVNIRVLIIFRYNLFVRKEGRKEGRRKIKCFLIVIRKKKFNLLFLLVIVNFLSSFFI